MMELVVVILEWKTLMKKTVEVERPAQNSMEVCTTFLKESKFELIYTVMHIAYPVPTFPTGYWAESCTSQL